MKITAVVLAAGEGKRMKSRLYKVLHPVCGKPMVGHVVDHLSELSIHRTLVIVGHGAEDVKSYLGNGVEYIFQSEQLGTGHAVLQAKDAFEHEEGITIVICGDTPLVQTQTLIQMINIHKEAQSAATILTAILENPHGYGRIIRDDQQFVTAIIEQKDCNQKQALIHEINTGTYCFDTQKLFRCLSQITNNNQQKEYYLTDVIRILHTQNEVVRGYCLEKSSESIGINDRVALAEAQAIMQERINRAHMHNGVTLIHPASTYIDADVRIGMDTIIYPNTHLKGQTEIGENCRIGPDSEIIDSVISDDVHIHHAVLHGAVIDSSTQVGPFAYLRPGTKLGKHVKIGDFVELKNASIDDGTKVNHLSYVGDAIVGKNVNIGCGAITVNYDGQNKHVTRINDDAFIGSNVNLIAPITIGQGAYIVAGSTISEDVNAGDMAIARERQTNKPGYAKILRTRIQKK